MPDGLCPPAGFDECVVLGGSYLGDDTYCRGDSDFDGRDDACASPPIPTAGTWGLVVIALSLLAIGKIAFGMRRRAAALG